MDDIQYKTEVNRLLVGHPQRMGMSSVTLFSLFLSDSSQTKDLRKIVKFQIQVHVSFSQRHAHPHCAESQSIYILFKTNKQTTKTNKQTKKKTTNQGLGQMSVLKLYSRSWMNFLSTAKCYYN